MIGDLHDMIGRAARRESVYYTEHGVPEVVVLVAWRPHYKQKPGQARKRRSSARVIRAGAAQSMTVKCRFIQPIPTMGVDTAPPPVV